MNYYSKSQLAEFTDSMKSIIESKLTKLNKYFKNDVLSISSAILKKEWELFKLEVSIHSSGMQEIRAQSISSDYYWTVDDIIEKLEKQIKKCKKLKYKNEFLSDFQLDEEIDDIYKLEREKILFPDSLTYEEAIGNMEMLGHDFYIYRDCERQDNICVVYRRFGNSYGLIETK